MTNRTELNKCSRMPFQSRIELALAEWKKVLPAEKIIIDANFVYGASTTGDRRTIPLALKAESRDEVITVMKIASAYLIPVYPISTGKNWGYGASNPVQNDCVLLDLSLMNRIIEVNADLCYVRLEPGVTQQQLFDYFETHNLDFMVPVTGAGPTCSILGNLLERGYGITPHTDHFGALLSLEAVLSDGQIYRSALEENAGQELNQAFKWGVGPYLDGLFSQSNLGIVTSATIAIQKRPEVYEAFLFRLTSESQLPAAVEAVREIIQTLGSTVGGINLMNSHRVLSMSASYPKHLIPEGQTMTEEMVKNMTRQYQIPAWTGAGAIYGNKYVVKAAKKVIKKTLKRHASGLIFVSPKKANALNSISQILSRILPAKGGIISRLNSMTTNLANLLRILGGEPTEVALPLSYMKSGRLPQPGRSLDPAKDGCGLMWYSPLVPMVPEKVLEYVETTKRICLENGIEPLITLTSISERCFDSTVPILFDKASPLETENARRCYEVLLNSGRLRGFFPYRFGISQMKHLMEGSSTFWWLVSKVKSAFDPFNLLSPGRYELLGSESIRMKNEIEKG